MLGEHEQSVWLEPTHILRETSPGTGTATACPTTCCNTRPRYGYQCCSHINVRFSLGSLLSIASLTPLPGGGPIVVDTLSILPLIAFFSAIGLHAYALCAQCRHNTPFLYGQINVFEHGYPSAGSFKPEYHDSTYQTELFGVKRGMDLDEDETFAELTEATYTAAAKGSRRSCSKIQRKSGTRFRFKTNLQLSTLQLAFTTKKVGITLLKWRFGPAVFCSLAIFGHLMGIIAVFAKALGHSGVHDDSGD